MPLWGIVAAVVVAAFVGGLLGNNTQLGSKEHTVNGQSDAPQHRQLADLVRH